MASTALGVQSPTQQPIRPVSDRTEARDTNEPGTARELDELRETIGVLERRVKELEMRLEKPEPPETAPASAEPVAEQPVAEQPVAAAPTAAGAPMEPFEMPDFFRNTEITGFVDLYYGYNFNNPDGDAQLRNFDTKHNQFGLNLVEIALEKKPTAGSRVGFRADFDLGPATATVHAAEPGGDDVFRHLEQAYVSYLAPVGEGLQVDVGKFVTPHGAEVIETKDNWNYSRSLLFALAIPYYHFGLRATCPIAGGRFAVSGFVVNGWNDVVDNNRGKTYGVQAAVKPTAKLSLVQNYMAGPEQADDTDDWRHISDTTVTYVAAPWVTLMGNYDYGNDRVAGAGVHWQGVAGYARFQATPRTFITPRVEWYDDHDGFTTGVRQTLKEFTITGERVLGDGMLARFEYRRDFSDVPYFARADGRLVSAQSTVTLGFVYSFSSFTGK